MRLVLSFAICVAFISPAAAADIPKPIGDKIVSPDAKWELLYTRNLPIQGGLTEGPAVAPDGSIYFTDIPVGNYGGAIMRFDPVTKETKPFTKDSGKANGLIFDSEGFLLSCEGADLGGRRVSRWNVRTGERKTVADNYQGKKFNAPNDLCLDSKGRVYFTDPKYLGDEKRELEHRAVYRVDKDGKVIEITHDIAKPNGIAISPDEKMLYVADHDNGTDKIDPTAPPPKRGPMKIYAYPLDANGLVSGSKTTLYDFGDQAGCDGMCVDAEGNLYLTSRGLKRPGVLVLAPQGQEIAFIATGPADQTDPKSPVGLPSNVEFGIKDEIHMLYCTVDLSLHRIKLRAKGYHCQYK